MWNVIHESLLLLRSIIIKLRKNSKYQHSNDWHFHMCVHSYAVNLMKPCMLSNYRHTNYHIKLLAYVAAN